MTGSVIFDPILGWAWVWGIFAVAAVFIVIAAWRGMAAWWLRGLAAAVLVLATRQKALLAATGVVSIGPP